MASKKEGKEGKEEKEGPECCSICSEHYTPMLRKKITCKFCLNKTCCKCIEQYLLGKHEDAHCLHCRVNYTDAMLKEICTKTYLQQRYFKHRQEVLINRERASLPGLQVVAMEERKRRERRERITVLAKEITAIKLQRDHLYLEHHALSLEYRTLKKEKEDVGDLLQRIAALDDQVREHTQQIYERRERMYQIHMEGRHKEEEKEDEKRKFIRRCMRTGCQGFLSTAWKCGICEWYSCSKCFMARGVTHDAEHECKKEDVETAELIKKDCKPCPNCGEFIEKSSGCFAADTAILLWNGSSKMSQDITVGDELVGDDGEKRTVLSTVSGEDTMYEVAQNNGMTYVVNSKHTLVLKCTGEKNIHWYETIQAWKIRWFDRQELYLKTKGFSIIEYNTKEEALRRAEEFKKTLTFPEEIEITIEEYMKLTDTQKKSLVGYKSSEINWAKQEVPLDPYMMGLYIGDGINTGTAFAINAPEDPEILEYILQWAEGHGCEVVHDEIYRFRLRRRDNKINTQYAIGHGATSDTCNGCQLKKSGFCDRPNIPYTNTYTMARKNPLCEILTAYDMVGKKKKIPMEYMVNDRETRLQLLAGIIDTDGHVAKMNDGKRISITSSNKDLAEQYVLLSQSLGFITSIIAIPKKGVSFSVGGEKKDYDDHYAVNISGNISKIPTRIARKKCVDSHPNKDMLRTSISVKNIGSGSYYGWSIDKNKRFILLDQSTVHNCSQMFCITCKTPWDWGTGKVVTSGPLHNPHYYEWMQRNGQTMARNPADVPCGGYPNAWELRRMPRRIKESVSHLFYEFHRLCQELQDVSTRNYRSHIDNTTVHDIHTRFLLGDFDEKHWGQLMAVNEKKRKRDQEIQDIFAAFRMVAVEFINRIHLYHTPQYASFTDLPVHEAENMLLHLNIEIQELITMINTALKGVSQSYSYAVPYINRSLNRDAVLYNMATMNFVEKKKRGAASDASAASAASDANDVNDVNDVNNANNVNEVMHTTSVSHAADATTIHRDVAINERLADAYDAKSLGATYRAYPADSDEEIDDPVVGHADNVYEFASQNTDLQRAIIASLTH